MTGFAHLETATESIFSAQNSWISDRFLTAAKEVRPVCDARPDDVKGIVCLVMFFRSNYFTLEMQNKLKYVECAVYFAQGNRKLNITILGFTSVLECSLGTLSIRHAYANT